MKRIRWRKRKLGFKKWWDRECTRKKRKAERMLKKRKRGSGCKNETLQEKREFMELCERKREKWRKKEMAEMNKIRTETEVWNYINKKRSRTRYVKISPWRFGSSILWEC